MSAARYRKFLRLCEEWPLDQSKTGRDLAAVIRQKVADAFRMGENTTVNDEAKCDQAYESLQRLSSDFYRKKYSANRTVGATGVSYEECKVVMSTEALKVLNDQNTGIFTKLKRTFTAERG
ncbi:hypothetical protein C0Q70_16787 [Pomacea canaliculata]|uniref:Mitochondrial nucleoid factor 1 n=1 Tax=Pomacea canaliculata TaxID=400727 RepID=A0A2T7NQR7_POMCA|nr:hypothetical protein C0Q70_16787 [Pomacea canaliculata]